MFVFKFSFFLQLFQREETMSKGSWTFYILSSAYKTGTYKASIVGFEPAKLPPKYVLGHALLHIFNL